MKFLEDKDCISAAKRLLNKNIYQYDTNVISKILYSVRLPHDPASGTWTQVRKLLYDGALKAWWFDDDTGDKGLIPQTFWGSLDANQVPHSGLIWADAIGETETSAISFRVLLHEGEFENVLPNSERGATGGLHSLLLAPYATNGGPPSQITRIGAPAKYDGAESVTFGDDDARPVIG